MNRLTTIPLPKNKLALKRGQVNSPQLNQGIQWNTTEGQQGTEVDKIYNSQQLNQGIQWNTTEGQQGTEVDKI